MKFKTKTALFIISFLLILFVFSFAETLVKNEKRAENVFYIDEENVSEFSKEEKREEGSTPETRFSLLSSSSEKSYIVTAEGEGYEATCGSETLFDISLSSLIERIESDGALIEFSGIESSETLNLTKSVTLSGSLSLSDAYLNLSGASISLVGFSFRGENSSLRVKSGATYAKSGSIESSGSSAVILDFHSSARFVLSGLEISSSTRGGAIFSQMGSVELLSGEVKNEYGAAIENKGSLTVSEATLISGLNFDITTDRPISFLGSEENSRAEKLRVMYKQSFERGSFTVVAHNANSDTAQGMTLYDLGGEEIPLEFFAESRYTEEKNILAVYLPYTVKFYTGTALYKTESFLFGESLEVPKQVEKTGYTFIGWYKDTAFSVPCVFGESVSSDMSLYAAFELTAPEFSISSLEFTYDGKRRLLGFDYLYHPLSDKGQFSFVWYKNSVAIQNSSPNIEISSVGDSGVYFCKLTFTYEGDFVSIDTPRVQVFVNKTVIEKPVIEPMIYTGYPLFAAIPESPFYTSSSVSFIDVGSYSLTLTLSDPQNSEWSDTEDESTTVSFEILKAENCFINSPRCENVYEGQMPKAVYKLKFGDGIAEYSANAESWSANVPLSAGKYYIRIRAEETKNYSGIISEAIEFTVYEELCTGIKVDKYPTKSEYIAFEKLDISGAQFTASYNSGRSEKIDIAKLKIEYKNGICLLVTDSSVSVSYGDCSVPIPVTVHPAEYDLSDIVFEDTEVVYNGQRHTAPVNATVVGKDGIPLLCKVSGGGIDVGEYSVTLSFTTESINYKLPSAVTKTLKINPLSLPVVYSDTEFIYDGSPKIPNATVIGAQGVPIKITLSGAATDAGEYIAYATLSDSNYTLTNTSVKFKILKADFDLSGIYWSEKDFTYDGTPHTVTIMGLPDGITLVGYANASFTDAGSYTAEAAITYDEKNYNTPAGLTHEWKINKADYVFSDFAFFDAEYVFDGLEHYPRVSGNAPVGYDGIALAYSFSRGVTHVAEGRQKVTVIFDSESKNYNTPSPLTAFVEITPKFIEVEWENLSFVYNASQQIPTARSAECKVKVTGSGVDAGDYTAFAISENSDYKISNNKIGFTILKANNLFTTELSATDIYEGDALSAFAKAFSGEVKYSFYKDKELAESVTFPLPVGTYYVIAEVEESKNYHSLKSAPVSFSVLEILPVELCVEFLEELVAMKRLSEHSVSVYLLNNNGSTTPLSKDELSVEYENGELLKAGDRMLKISAYGFSRELAISVKKSVVDLPTLAPITYNGKVIFPSELLSPLFIHDFSGAKDAGEYAVHFALTDSDNYEFRGGISTLTLLINKAPITLEVNKNGSSYKLLYGIIFDGDELYEEYYESDGKVFLRINNPNYELTVIPREEKNGAFYVLLMFLLGIVILLATLGLYIVFWKKERYGTSTNPKNSNEPHNSKPFSDSSLKQNNSTVTKFNATEKLSNPIMSPKKTSKPISKDLSNAKSENEKAENGKKEFPLDPPLETLLAVDESYANNLISDQVAKSLIAEDVTVVETDGKRRCILNLDTISESFSAGETVSINDFKRKGLIPSDARYVKILARGVIDKPITILANSFSLPAVKMIALTGGSAKRVRTVKRKL